MTPSQVETHDGVAAPIRTVRRRSDGDASIGAQTGSIGGETLSASTQRQYEAESRLPWLTHRAEGALFITQPDQASIAIADSYSPAKLDLHGHHGDFSLQMRLTELPDLNLGYFKFGSPVRVSAPPPSCYVVCLAPSGRLDVASGREVRSVTGTDGAVIFPGDVTYFENWSPGSELMSVRIEQRALEQKLTQLMGRAPTEPIRFRLELDLAAQHTASLRRALRMLHAEAIEPGGLILDPVAAASLSGLVAMSLLVSQPHNYSQAMRGPTKAAPPSAVRAAQELIDAEPMAISTVGELAARVHSSVRALEEGFQRHLNISPMNYLRRTRLHRAHRDLVSANPTDHTVALIAHGWGFRHLGRFSQTYRSQFGELPSETLHKSKR